jgi:hypothetical protein
VWTVFANEGINLPVPDTICKPKYHGFSESGAQLAEAENDGTVEKV